MRARHHPRLLPERAVAVLVAGLTAALSPLASTPAGAVASDWARNPQSQVRLLSGELVAARQGELRLGLQFRLAPGWHVYWKNSGDAGFAPILTLAAPGLTGGSLLWPAPHRFQLPGDLEAFGYAGEVVYPVRATLASGGTAGAGPLVIAANIDYLTCQVDCVPYRYTLTLRQPLGERAMPDPELAPLLEHWWNQLPVPADRLPGVSTSGRFDASHPEAPVLAISVRGLRPAAGGPDLFLEPNDELATGRPQARESPGGLVFRIPVKSKVAGRPLPASAAFAWTVTGLLPAADIASTPQTAQTAQTGGAAAPSGPPFAIESRGDVSLAAAAAAGDIPAAELAGGAHLSRFGLGPVTAALLAALALAAALFSWGVLAKPEETRGSIATALGFAALAAALLPLYALALQVQPEGLAGIELLLLAMALLAWLRRRTGGRGKLRFVLTLAVVACAAGLLWLADHSRLERTENTRGDSHVQRQNR
jgi:DsbC/DsbD-like thiol-disulfide interchange protein